MRHVNNCELQYHMVISDEIGFKFVSNSEVENSGILIAKVNKTLPICFHSYDQQLHFRWQ